MNKQYCVYLTIYSGNKMPPFYIGSTSISKIEKGYRGSVKSKKYSSIWKNELITNPHLFKTKIVKTFETRMSAILWECYSQKHLKVITSPMHINQAYAQPKGFAGRDQTGELNGNYGKRWSADKRMLASENNHMRGKFIGIHKITGERKMVDCGNPNFYGIAKEINNYRGQSDNKIVVRDCNGDTLRVDITDPRYLSGELVHHTKGYKTIINTITGAKERLLLTEIDHNIHQPLLKGHMHFVDQFGTNINAKIDDPRVISGELIAFSKGKITVKDRMGTTFRVNKTDPRYLCGELVHHTKGTRNAYNNVTNLSMGRIDINDPRWNTGELITKPNI